MISRLIIFLVLGLFSGTALAQTPAIPVNDNKDEPLEITADQTLEWHRKDQKYIARGSAIAKQGTVQIQAETLVADYRASEESDYDIYKMTATDNVVITSDNNNVFGDNGVYDIDSGTAIMTGNNLKMVSPEQIVTARDSFEYFIPEEKVTATGNVRVDRGTDIIEGDVMSAFFTKNAQGSNELTRLTANGNVVITTPTEILYGDRGVYNAKTEIAELTGNVRIERGPNILEGDRAEVNLRTDISKMETNSPGGSKRVRGVFYPGSSSSEQPEPQPVPAPIQNQRLEQPAPSVQPMPAPTAVPEGASPAPAVSPTSSTTPQLQRPVSELPTPQPETTQPASRRSLTAPITGPSDNTVNP